MSHIQPHILIIDDNRSVNRALSLVLQNDFHVSVTTSAKEGLEIARESHPFLAMVDLKMPEVSGIAVLKEFKRVEPETKVIIMTAYGEIGVVVEAFKEGAVDFLTKPFDNRTLLENVRKLAALTTTAEESLQPGIKDIVGESPAMKYVWELVRRFAPPDIPVLLQGETGTGKELFAKLIHSMSLRSTGPFVPVDCSALPASLIESELFGYEKGAFTGAMNRKEGLFESANMGTLFLDEIGNLPLPIQAKLLRVTQDHSIIHLGSKGYEPIPLDIRIIAATNIDLKEASQRGEFRQDLYYRISAAMIRLPPLRERQGDIPGLVSHFLEQCNREFHKSGGITEDAMSLLNKYHWPGNIRELENVVRSAFLISDDVIRPCHLSRILIEKAVIAANFMNPDDSSLDIKTLRNAAAEEVERQAILQIMKTNPFINKTELAKLLRFDPKTLRNRLKKYGFNPD